MQKLVSRATGVIGTTEQTFSYDAAGRLTASTDNNDPADSTDDASVSRSYDALGRTTAETLNGRTVSSSYTGSYRTGITYPNGTQITRSYDAAGNLDTVKRDGTTVADYSYNSRNLTTGATFGNGVTLSNQHDNLGRMTGRSYNKDGQLIAGFSYGYDAMGNKLYQQDTRQPEQSELYGYDNRDRLTSWERGELNADKDGIVTTEADQNWNLDPVGNWDATTFDGVTEQRDHNAVNELTHRENGIIADLRYDDNGNLIEDSEYEYAYDAFNRLVKVTDKTNGKVIAEYTYDTKNRRVTRDAVPEQGPPVSVEYSYDGWQVVEEHVTRGGGNGKGRGNGKGNGKGRGKGKGRGNGNGGGQGAETVRTYTYGNYIDEPITMTASGAGRGGTYYYHTNNLYNVRALTDEGGDVIERYQYSAYGEPTILDDAGNERQRSAVGNVYMFQGRRMDSETGLYYYRNRYYSVQLGRFVTRDPMGYVDGYNLYQYAGSFPTSAGDPLGLFQPVLTGGLSPLAEEIAEWIWGSEEGKETKFYVVGEDIEAQHRADETRSERLQRDAATALGLMHTDVYHGPEQNASLIRTGFAIGEEPSHSQNISDHKIWELTKREDCQLRWGKGVGEDGECASDEAIADCIKSAPQPRRSEFSAWGNTCHQDVQHAIEGCCLEGFEATGPDPEPWYYLSDEERRNVFWQETFMGVQFGQGETTPYFGYGLPFGPGYTEPYGKNNK